MERPVAFCVLALAFGLMLLVIDPQDKRLRISAYLTGLVVCGILVWVGPK